VISSKISLANFFVSFGKLCDRYFLITVTILEHFTLSQRFFSLKTEPHKLFLNLTSKCPFYGAHNLTKITNDKLSKTKAQTGVLRAKKIILLPLPNTPKISLLCFLESFTATFFYPS
jgi:hypothetical protein